MSNPDINKIAASVAVDLTKDFFRSTAALVPKATRRLTKYLHKFDQYLTLTHERCSHVRTILNKDASFHIDEIYVPGNFRMNKEVITDQDLIQIIRDSKPTVVVGFGGIGKTVFTKKLWCSIFNEPFGKIPVFLELRRLNGITEAGLTAYIRHSISTRNDEIDQDVFESFLSSGMFIFIFDGFDELAESKKEKISREILDLSHRFPENGIVVSSRHHDLFYSWQKFSVIRAMSFDKIQTELLVSKVPYEKNTKKLFKKEIIDRKYEQYREFLSTPLLTMMMLMTFSQFAEVPEKKSVFYRYAFLTMYSWHDSSKEVFNREKQSGLTLDEFEKVFSLFCFLTYTKRRLEFSSAELRESLQRTKNYVSPEFDIERLVAEICESVNLMYKDGDTYVFTHRSFQEYFSAYAIVNYLHSKIPELIDHLDIYGDSVLPLMAEINLDVVDEYYLEKIPQDYVSEMQNVIKERDYRKIAEKSKIYIVMGLSGKDGGYGVRIYGVHNKASCWQTCRNISQLFSQEFNKDGVDRTDLAHEVHDILPYDVVSDHIPSCDLVPGKDIIFVYNIASNSFGISFCDNSIDDFDSGIERVIETGVWRNISSDKWIDISKKVCANVKATYIFSSRQIIASKKRIGAKNKGIDAVLSDLRI